jgi:tetrahydrodipicolinate N-succinyltransferase
MTMFDFGNGPVPAHRHPNGRGWVADTATVAETAYVGANAKVYGNAWVHDNAHVYGNARVYGDANVYGDAHVYSNAWVYGNALVYGNAWVYGNARVYGNAWVYGDAHVSGNARVSGNAWVYDNVQLKRGEYSTSPISINRSDGYTFTLQSDGSIVAGCRDFTAEEADAYWGNPDHNKHKESVAILAALRMVAESRFST